ncbi:branched-chain amino acid ABC transporter permease [Streptomyces sp. ACA25]|uniref:branched-chain amino acid ABC transporter permease n=1 Tax=Streptomyces sp. ACA25 TaxID=3022596 RepID=UPI002307477D|nr:branched-chain amino acid ABC transporter permease [Streptomyces sp. ACA25]MDB1088581.1 branched-chain amino acid ABC transporter permease [Streptomyces sp. ACA25]
MSTQTSIQRAAMLRKVAWYQQPRFKRLVALLATAVVLAQVTGADPSRRDIFHALRENFTGVAIWVWLALALLIWVVREFAHEQARTVWGSTRSAAGRPVGVVRRTWESDARLRYGALAVLLVFVLAVPFLVSNHWQTVMVHKIAIFMLLAIGLNVVVGWAGMLDLGFIAFFAIGAYSAAFWTGALPVQPPVELNNFLVIPLAIVACLVAGVLLGAPTLRLRGDYLAIVTLGFHEIVYLTAKNWTAVTNGSSGAVVDGFEISLSFWQYEFGLDNKPYYYFLVASICLVVFLFLRLEHSRVGRAWTAIREDEVAAAATGINTVRMKLLAFAIGASTSGVAGVVYVSALGHIGSELFIILTSVLVLSYVIFGGMGSIPGVLVGSALLLWLPERLRGMVSEEDRYMYLGALLVIMMIYRPQGMLPSKRRQRELRLAEEGIVEGDGTGSQPGGKQA